MLSGVPHSVVMTMTKPRKDRAVLLEACKGQSLIGTLCGFGVLFPISLGLGSRVQYSTSVYFLQTTKFRISLSYIPSNASCLERPVTTIDDLRLVSSITVARLLDFLCLVISCPGIQAWRWYGSLDASLAARSSFAISPLSNGIAWCCWICAWVVISIFIHI